MIKRLIYGAMGISASGLLLTVLLTSKPDPYLAQSQSNIAAYDESSNHPMEYAEEWGSEDDGRDTHSSLFDTYHINDETLKELKEKGGYGVGRTNPMYFWEYVESPSGTESSDASFDEPADPSKEVEAPEEESPSFGETPSTEENDEEATPPELKKTLGWKDYTDAQKGELAVPEGYTLGFDTSVGVGEEESQMKWVNVADAKELFKEDGRLPVASKYYRVSSSFGPRVDPVSGQPDVFHNGTDISAKGIDGKDVYSVLPGTVSEKGFNKGGYGHYIVVSHDGFTTTYAHLTEESELEVEATVKAGEKIGSIGSTGRSTGPHLHFEVVVNGISVNPEEMLNKIKN